MVSFALVASRERSVLNSYIREWQWGGFFVTPGRRGVSVSGQCELDERWWGGDGQSHGIHYPCIDFSLFLFVCKVAGGAVGHVSFMNSLRG